MKLLLLGDLHLQGQSPKLRTDQYEETQFRKVSFLLDTAIKNQVDLIIQPGDMFNSPMAPYHLFQRYANAFLKASINIISIFGQHDLRYRTSRINTPLWALHAAGILHVQPSIHEIKNTVIHSVNFEEPIPTLMDKDPNKFYVLVIHKMIIENKIWEGQEDYELASAFLQRYPYDLVVSGDNHQRFFESFQNRYLFNMGSLMRSSIDQIHHEPAICLFNTTTRKYEIIRIPIQDYTEVFDLERKEKEDKKLEELEPYIQNLAKTEDIGLNFVSNLKKRLAQEDVEESVAKILLESLEG